MFNVILELISENRPKRNPEITERKETAHTKEISYLSVPLSLNFFILMNS